MCASINNLIDFQALNIYSQLSASNTLVTCCFRALKLYKIFTVTCHVLISFENGSLRAFAFYVGTS